METQQRRLIHPIDEQQLSTRRKGTGYEERMIFLFGIAVIVFGISAMVILRVRVPSPHPTPEAVNDAKSFQDSLQQRTGDELQWLDRRLNLSREQEGKVRPVVEEEVRERAALLETPSISTSEQKSQLIELRNHALEEMRPVLTNRQQTALRDMEQPESADPAPRSGD